MWTRAQSRLRRIITVVKKDLLAWLCRTAEFVCGRIGNDVQNFNYVEPAWRKKQAERARYEKDIGRESKSCTEVEKCCGERMISEKHVLLGAIEKKENQKTSSSSCSGSAPKHRIVLPEPRFHCLIEKRSSYSCTSLMKWWNSPKVNAKDLRTSEDRASPKFTSHQITSSPWVASLQNNTSFLKRIFTTDVYLFALIVKKEDMYNEKFVYSKTIHW